MKILNSNSKNFDKNLDSLLLKRKRKVQSNSVSVSSIIKDVRKNGDKALVKYEKKFNQNNVIVPSQKQISNSIKSLDKKVKQAIDIAYNRIYKFHSLQKFKNISYVDKYKNKLEYKYLPLESVAIYVPGSTASYPSSVLMNAIPAIVAGVKRLVMVNPGQKGKQNPAVLYAAKKCKIKEIYSIGGPSAIAAVAYGTKKIKKVDKNSKREFLNNCHIQGDDRCSVAYGLYYKDSLVSIMTFCKSRFDKKIEWEISRFCNSLNTRILGGASKLFSVFLEDYKPNSVVSYSDRRFFTGDIYNKLGMQFVGNTAQGYHYVSPDFSTLFNRQMFQKSKLKKKLQKFDESLSEWENMKVNGFDRIWDCGHSKWIYKPKTA